MCVKKQWIRNKYDGRMYYVECGHCPACLQIKANKRAFRIIAHSKDGFSDYDRVFCNFTYTNDYVPYIKNDEMRDFFNMQRDTLPLYRNKSIRTFYNRHTGEYSELISESDKPFVIKEYTPEDFASVFNPDIANANYQFLRKAHNRFNAVEYGKIGILFYKDIQDFIKRLRRKLDYLGYEFNLSYFACTEYGSNTIRPHVHLLLFVPKGYFTQLKSTIASCWLFDDVDRRLANIEEAFKPARYIASYVNSDSTVQGLLRLNPFKQKHVYSQKFGFGKSAFSLAEVAKKIRKGDATYLEKIVRNGVPESSSFLYPKYVISRYFPKYKGFAKLTCDEVYAIAENPLRIYNFAKKLGLLEDEDTLENRYIYSYGKKFFLPVTENHFEQVHKVFKMLLNKKLEFEKICPDWAYLYSRVWSVRASSSLKMWHSLQIIARDILESYDNIEDFYTEKLDPDYCDFVKPIFENSVLLHYETDPNKFRQSLCRHDYYTNLYHQRDKAKKEFVATIGKYTYQI